MLANRAWWSSSAVRIDGSGALFLTRPSRSRWRAASVRLDEFSGYRTGALNISVAARRIHQRPNPSRLNDYSLERRSIAVLIVEHIRTGLTPSIVSDGKRRENRPNRFEASAWAAHDVSV